MRTIFMKSIFTIVLLIVVVSVNAQIRYTTNGRLTIGNTQPYEFYNQTIYGTGMYFKFDTSNFFQIDVSPAATRLASHLNQIVFYNTKTNTFNSIQVKSVYNQSDARDKTNIQTLNQGLNLISQLRPVRYDFKNKDAESSAKFRLGGEGKEIGLLAQDVEQVLPDIVLTDPDGKKLINYTALIPILIDAVKELRTELEELKASK